MTQHSDNSTNHAGQNILHSVGDDTGSGGDGNNGNNNGPVAS
ncbi:hypothetical protein [Streptomyces halobius]|nr:hypothetical protein [Streptomyces halobius]